MSEKTKIGCKRKEPKRYYLKRSKIKPKSKKRIKEEPEYFKLVNQLRELSGNISELNREKPDWQTEYKTEPHHICGRDNGGYINPFNIILITRNQHNFEESRKTFERKQELLKMIYPIRISQGFKPEDYE